MKNPEELYSLRDNREMIFIESLNELKDRIGKNEPYSLIRKSAILRFLLIDGSRFYDEINRNYKLDLRSQVSAAPYLGQGASSEKNANRSALRLKYYLDPNGEWMNIPKFLEQPILEIDNPKLKEYFEIEEEHIFRKYNINQFIKLIANAHGGVHIKKWDRVSIDLMSERSSPFNINSNSMLHDMIDNVVEIVIELLKPLLNKVNQNILEAKPIAWEIKQVVELKF